MYLYVTLTARTGRMDELGAVVAWIKPGMERRGMNLVAGYQTERQIIDIWEIPDANTVVDALSEAAAHPSHEHAMARLAECVESEVLRIVEKTTYSP